MFCNCRMRSRVTPNFLPTSSSVFGLPPSSPKREKMILRSRSSSTSSKPPTSLRRFLSRNNSNGVCASSSPTISPNSVESSSLIGASRRCGPNRDRLQLRNFSAQQFRSLHRARHRSVRGPAPRSFARRRVASWKFCPPDEPAGELSSIDWPVRA